MMGRAMFRLRSLLTAAVCLVLIACQPPGGDLVPVAQSGITLTTARFENDTAQITRDGVSVKAYGTWRGNSETDVTVVVNNSSPGTVRADLAKLSLVNSTNERGEIGYIKEKKGSERVMVYVDHDANAYRAPEVKAGEKRAFVVNISYPYKEESRNVLSQTATLSVPVTGAKDFEFAFRYAEARADRSTPDPVD